MAGDVHLSLLDQVRIASPCTARWEDMIGDDVTRHCAQCDLDVHNLSAMRREDAETFLRERIGDGRVCARLFRRSDGTVLTQDCPVGLAAIRARARRTVVRVAAAFAALLSAVTFAQVRASSEDRYFVGSDSVREFTALDRLVTWIRPSCRIQYSGFMGAIAFPAVASPGAADAEEPGCEPQP